MVELFLEEPPSGPAVRGVLHRPAQASGDGIVLTHGAGSNHEAPLLRALAEAFAESGWIALRCDLPFRQARQFGPPFPAGAGQDREGLRNAVAALGKIATGRLYLGGHSYGGRQASMLAASEPAVAGGLLLLSYPLHPPKRPAQLRTDHFSELHTRGLFVHGGRDPFGTFEEMQAALALIPAVTALMPVPGAGHELIARAPGPAADLARRVVAAFLAFVQ
jgi:predicted alpha/beta-hydrolase family hydrolase